jgi:hypothetical protein
MQVVVQLEKHPNGLGRGVSGTNTATRPSQFATGHVLNRSITRRLMTHPEAAATSSRIPEVRCLERLSATGLL